MEAVLYVIVAILIWVGVPLVGDLLALLIASVCKRKAHSREFRMLRDAVVCETLVTNLPVRLRAVREFMLAHELIAKPEFSAFYRRWLSNPIVASGIPCNAMFSWRDRALLRDQIDALHL